MWWRSGKWLGDRSAAPCEDDIEHCCSRGKRGGAKGGSPRLVSPLSTQENSLLWYSFQVLSQPEPITGCQNFRSQVGSYTFDRFVITIWLWAISAGPSLKHQGCHEILISRIPRHYCYTWTLGMRRLKETKRSRASSPAGDSFTIQLPILGPSLPSEAK